MRLNLSDCSFLMLSNRSIVCIVPTSLARARLDTLPESRRGKNGALDEGQHNNKEILR